MQCLECRQENPPEARFCAHCGNRLDVTCSRCGARLPAGARYCPQCGHPTADATTTKRRIEPEPLAGDPLERRIVTILFCDIKGFSTFSERLDPEAVSEIMNGAFEVLVAPVNRFGGTVARLMGDAILAFFGAPRAHEDDPERAVHAGLEILAGVREYAARLERERGIAGFTARVGINTGEVVVGEIGAQTAAEYTAMGDAVNVAARLEQAAEPGTILISAATCDQVAHAFEVDSLGAIDVQGREQRVEVYRVMVPLESAAKRRGIAGATSALVGRRQEMEALSAAVDKLRGGVGGIVTVVGEAGIGKSRLIEEARAGAPDLHWIEGRCLSYGAAIPYHLWLDLLRELLDLPDEAEPDNARRRLLEELGPLAGDPQAGYAESLARVLAPDGEATNGAGMDSGAEQMRRETFAAMEGLLEAVARRRPTVIVCEDLHWADPTSLDLLEQAFTLTDRAPLLFVCALRQDPEHGSWRVREIAARRYPHRHTDIVLGPLSAAESETLARNLLGWRETAPAADARPQSLLWSILGHSEGNPLYVEEVIRSLIAAGALASLPSGGWQVIGEAADISIPPTLHGVLVARVDRLPTASRRVLQLASVIGRIFTYRVLAAIVGEDHSLDEELVTLQREEMIRERARVPEREYIFKHHLTQEAVYDTLLKRERTAYHRRVAETLERLFAGRLEERVEQLAHHWERAGDTKKACAYLLQAGARARRLGASLEAIQFYQEALQLANQAPAGAGCQPAHLIHEVLADIYLENLGLHEAALEHYAAFQAGATSDKEQARAARKAADVYLTRGDLTQAEKSYEIALAHLAGVPTTEEACRVHFGLSYFHMSRNHLIAAEDHARAALEVAESLGDMRGLADSYKMLGVIADYRGDLDASVDYLARSLALYRQMGDLPRIAIACNNLADSLRLQGRLDEALAEMEEGLKVARQIGDTRDESLLLITTGEVLIDQGRPEEAIPILERGLSLAEESGVAARIIPAQHALGVACREAGRLDDARRYLVAAEQAGRERSHARYLPWIALDLAQLELAHHDPAAASTWIAHAEEAGGPDLSGALAGLIERERGNISLARAEWDEAVSRLERAVRLLDEAGQNVALAQARQALALAYADRGRDQDIRSACQQLHAARAALHALGAPRHVAKADAEITRLGCTP